MRHSSFLLIGLFACAPEAGSPDLNEAALETGPTVTVTVDADYAFVELRAVRLDEEGTPTFIGSPLRTVPVTEGVASITMPVRPNKLDKNPEATDAPVRYVAFAYMDHPTEDNVYYGHSVDSVVYFNGKRGVRRGWYVESMDDTGTASWASTDKPVVINPGLLSKGGVGLSGKKGTLPVSDGTLLIGFESVDGFVDTTADLDDTFTASVTGTPDSTQALPDGTEYAVLTPRIFVDADEDGVYGGEDKAIGVMCWKGAPVYLEWIASPRSPEAALSYQANGVSVGWSAHATADEGPILVPDRAEVLAHGSCAGYSDVPDENPVGPPPDGFEGIVNDPGQGGEEEPAP